MSGEVAKLTASLALNSSNFEAGLAKANARLAESNGFFGNFFNSAQKGFAQAGKAVEGFVGKIEGFKAGIVALVGAYGMTELIKSQIESATAVKELSERLDLSTDSLQKFQYASKLSRVEATTFETAVERLNSKIASGALHYKDTQTALYSIANAVASAKTEMAKLAIVNDAFGTKLGAKMLPLLNQGAAGLKKLGQEAQDTGNVIDGETIDATKRFSDQLQILISTTEKNFQKGFLQELVGKSGDLRDIYTDPKFAEGIKGIGELFGLLAKAMVGVVDAIGGIISGVTRLNDNPAWQSYLQKIVTLRGGDSSGILGAFYNKPAPAPPDAEEIAFQKAWAQYNKTGAPGAIGPPAPNGNDGTTAPYVPSGKTTAQTANAYASILSSLKTQTDELRAQNELWGQNDGLIEQAKEAMKIQNQLSKDGITLTQSQRAELNKYLQELAQQKQLQEEQKKYQEEMKGLTDTIEQDFTDAIFKGGKLSTVFNNLAKQLAEMAFKADVLKPLFGDGSNGSTGLLTGFVSMIGRGIFGPPPGSYATGIARVPYDMAAFIHKDEEIVPAQEARSARRNGGAVTVNVIDNVGNKVSANATESNGGTTVEVMLDQLTAKNMSRSGTRTNDALKAQASRTIVRR